MLHKAKKSLGQNFLKSQAALGAIVRAGDIQKTDTILEIGPGKGALTEKLLSHAGKVIAIEKDNDLFAFLSEKFSAEINAGNFLLLHDDILEFDEKKYFKKKTYKLIANIPYNITGAILKKFLSSDSQPERMVVLVQKEVAERIVARPSGKLRTGGKESILSLSVKAYGTPIYIEKVPARYFSPAPKVDSAIIAIQGISRKLFSSREKEEHFFQVIKAGFAHKRKMLVSNLKSAGYEPASAIASCGIATSTRAEDLSLDDWTRLSEALY